MSGASALSNAVVNLAAIKENDRRVLASIIDTSGVSSTSLRSTKQQQQTNMKALVLDSYLTGPLGVVVEVNLLKVRLQLTLKFLRFLATWH